MNHSLPSVSDHVHRRRLLQIFSRYREYGGEEGSIYRIGDALVQGYDVGTFLASSRDVFPGGFVRNAVGAGKAFANWKVFAQLSRYQRVGRYEAWFVHNVFPAMSPSVYKLAFRLGVPVIQYLHNYRMGCVNGFFLNHGEPCQRCMHGNFYPALATACWHDSHLHSGVMGAVMMRARGMDLFNRINRWIAISEVQRREHVAMGIPADRISVIHHFLESTSSPPAYPDHGDVLFVGRLSSEKGVDRLLAAWKRIQDCGRRLWIVGDGPDRERLERISGECSLRNVHFTGFLRQQEMADIWEKAAFTIVPSIWKEPFGMVVLEAWAKGRPVIAHRIGAMPELIDDGSNGLLVTPDDPEELGCAMLELIENPSKGIGMGQNGLAKLTRDFSKEVWMKKIQLLIESVLPENANNR